METGLVHAHSGLRYIVFLLLLITIVKTIMNMVSKKEWGASDSKITLFLMASTHTQMLLGFILYIMFKYYKLMGQMSDPLMRWKAVEHLGMMLIFVALLTVMHVVNKKPAKKNKNRRALILGLISLVVGLAAIPFDRWF